MTKSFLHHSFLALATFLLGGVASAQFVGPAVQQATTVTEVLTAGTDDMPVVLRGRLLKQVGSDKYEFSDETATVLVEIDRETFAGEKVDNTMELELRGELEKDLVGSPEIDVHSIRRLTAQDR